MPMTCTAVGNDPISGMFSVSSSKTRPTYVPSSLNQSTHKKQTGHRLGVWLDSQLATRHQAEEGKEGHEPASPAHRAANCRKVMVVCVRSVAMFGSELWWKGNQVHGTIGRAADLQTPVNHEARATLGAFRSTNLGWPRIGVRDQQCFGPARQPEETVRTPALQHSGGRPG